MDLLEAFRRALILLLTGDPGLWRVIRLSLQVSGVALFFSALMGVPVGAWLGLYRVPSKRLLMALLYTGMGLPPVVVGLFVYLLLSRSGPLGWLGWLFTPKAMVLAQVIISFPLVAGFTMAAVMGVDPELRQQLRSLGATEGQIVRTVLSEARIGVIVSLVAGLGSIISEVGAVMLVGGNIEGRTRVLTTAIVLETQKGDFDFAMALGLVLLGLAFAINSLFLLLQGRMMESAYK